MKTIYKYELEVIDHQIVQMPNGYEILTVQLQNGKPCLWAMVDPERSACGVEIIIKGTGHPLMETVGDYISTFQMDTHRLSGELVFHVFTRA